MCGIAGIVASDPGNISGERLKKMTDIISHRGPDSEDRWISNNGRVGLGHRRLSIIDLSSHAGQPMHFMDRYTIVYNGEIYNYIELREKLIKCGYKFHTTSDTEVLMALYDRQGEGCLQELDGMFAFAIYDAHLNELFCARDRFGEKPFYYSCKQGEYFVFASEMKAIWSCGIERRVNNKMLYNYLCDGSLEDAHNPATTFYENCHKLPHSHYMKVDVSSITVKTAQYYDINWKHTNTSSHQNEIEDKLEELLFTSIKRRLRSDVSVGSSLSGGLDSSLIVCIINELLKGSFHPQKTFSAVFPGFAKDESFFIKSVTHGINVEPKFITPSSDGMIRDLKKLFFHQEEPIRSSSIYVQYCVMQLAKENGTTVLLDGQGADEIFGGYHFYYKSYHDELKRTNSSAYKDEYLAYHKMRVAQGRGFREKFLLAPMIQRHIPSPTKYLRKLKHKIIGGQETILSPEFQCSFSPYRFKQFEQPVSLNHSLYLGIFKKGLQELLRYADRNGMAHSREVRLPFLSHELVDYMFELPSNFKIRDGWTKWIMRKTFKDLMPQEVVWRKDKIGYEAPQAEWLKKDEMVELVNESKTALIEQGVLNAKKMNGDQKYNIDRVWRILQAGQLFLK